MSGKAALPRGFERRETDGATLVAASEWMPQLLARGLDRGAAWSAAAAAGAWPQGRGAAAHVELAPGRRAVIKQLRRGGLLAPLWRERFVGQRRLVDNLRVPLEAIARGVATARPVALLLVAGPPGLWRAWLATEEIAKTRDLRLRLAGPDPPGPSEIDAVAAAVRSMHDRGVDHPDLNLGNLLLADPGSGPPRAFVIDLDRARLASGPLGLAPRMRALRRIERSAVKLFGERPLAAFDVRLRFYQAYAAGDPRLGPAAERARQANRFWIGVHRLAWPAPTGRNR